MSIHPLFKREFERSTLTSLLVNPQEEQCKKLASLLSANSSNTCVFQDNCQWVQCNLPLAASGPNVTLRFAYDTCAESIVGQLGNDSSTKVALKDPLTATARRMVFPVPNMNGTVVSFVPAVFTLLNSTTNVEVRFVISSFNAQIWVDSPTFNSTSVYSFSTMAPLKCLSNPPPLPLILGIILFIICFGIVVSILRYFFLKRHPGANPELIALEKEERRERKEAERHAKKRLHRHGSVVSKTSRDHVVHTGYNEAGSQSQLSMHLGNDSLTSQNSAGGRSSLQLNRPANQLAMSSTPSLNAYSAKSATDLRLAELYPSAPLSFHNPNKSQPAITKT